jgi:wyosine [tRNA(Phe)-imidazoG37] synthetase (radical SAM superfamily)
VEKDNRLNFDCFADTLVVISYYCVHGIVKKTCHEKCNYCSIYFDFHRFKQGNLTLIQVLNLDLN